MGLKGSGDCVVLDDAVQGNGAPAGLLVPVAEGERLPLHTGILYLEDFLPDEDGPDTCWNSCVILMHRGSCFPPASMLPSQRPLMLPGATQR